VWTENALRAFITNPTEHTPGTSMASPGISWSMAPAIVDYLRNTRQAAPRD
jgi:cytochrome c2